MPKSLKLRFDRKRMESLGVNTPSFEGDIAYTPLHEYESLRPLEVERLHLALTLKKDGIKIQEHPNENGFYMTIPLKYVLEIETLEQADYRERAYERVLVNRYAPYLGLWFATLLIVIEKGLSKFQSVTFLSMALVVILLVIAVVGRTLLLFPVVQDHFCISCETWGGTFSAIFVTGVFSTLMLGFLICAIVLFGSSFYYFIKILLNSYTETYQRYARKEKGKSESMVKIDDISENVLKFLDEEIHEANSYLDYYSQPKQYSDDQSLEYPNERNRPYKHYDKE